MEGFILILSYFAIMMLLSDSQFIKRIVLEVNMTEQEAKQVLESMLNQMEWMPKTESKDILRDALRIAIEKLDIH